MKLAALEASLADPQPSDALSPELAALWYAANGDWQRSHEIVQVRATREADWVHAYLHRVEGDLANAAYWYRRAGHSPADGDLKVEWRDITAALLEANQI